MSTAQRLLVLLDHLGLASAHFATQMPIDLAELATVAAGRIAGLVLVVPTRLDPGAFGEVAARTLLVAGGSGLTADVVQRACLRMPAARVHLLEAYAASGWSDVAADRGSELAQAMISFLAVSPISIGPAPSRPGSKTGHIAGISYRIEGHGPPLVLAPFFLAASQWDPIVATLARHFTVIRIGGAHVGGVAALEDRARSPSYGAMLRSLVEIADIKAGDRVLDVGCGSGALTRLMARHLGPGSRIDAMDVNGYLLAEGRAIAEAEGLTGNIHYTLGSAETLPFADGTFDCALCVTVLEECHADLAIAEMVRVVRPGGRVGIIVRAIDMPQWWSPDLDDDLKEKAQTPPQSVASGGVADKSLYARMRRAGLDQLVPFPTLVTLDRPGSTIWRYREDHVLSLFDANETARWKSLAATAADTVGLFQSHPMHCAVGWKPGQA